MSYACRSFFISQYFLKNEGVIRVVFDKQYLYAFVIASHLFTLLPPWNTEIKGCAFADFRFHPDISPVSFNDFFADGKPDAGARIFCLGMESLEHDKDAVKKIPLYAYTIVTHRKYPFVALVSGPYVDAGLHVTAKLDSIADKVLKNLAYLQIVGS